jgi:hypothetical protein
MATINESTITLFLAKLSLDVKEQTLYRGHEKEYLAKVTEMAQHKKDALISGHEDKINNAAIAEQKGFWKVTFGMIVRK